MEETKQQKGHRLGAGKHNRRLFEKRITEYNLNPVKCLHCNKPIPYHRKSEKKNSVIIHVQQNITIKNVNQQHTTNIKTF